MPEILDAHRPRCRRVWIYLESGPHHGSRMMMVVTNWDLCSLLHCVCEVWSAWKLSETQDVKVEVRRVWKDSVKVVVIQPA